MSANKEAKKQIVEDIKAKIQASKSIILIDYKGLTVAEDTAFRSEMRKSNTEYKVLKNIGTSTKELGRSINKEVTMFYLIPVMVGLVHSYFAIGALGNIISIDLTKTFVISVNCDVMRTNNVSSLIHEINGSK